MPVRTCCGCRKRAEKVELVRIVFTGEGAIVDAKGVMPGRGAYVCHRRECLEAALQKGGLSRTLKTKSITAVSGFEDVDKTKEAGTK